MFLRPELEELANFTPEWTLICVPSFLADPQPTEHVKVILQSLILPKVALIELDIQVK
jgi:ATP-dependent phosphoenolpyruvate carboxykinase